MFSFSFSFFCEKIDFLRKVQSIQSYYHIELDVICLYILQQFVFRHSKEKALIYVSCGYGNLEI